MEAQKNPWFQAWAAVLKSFRSLPAASTTASRVATGMANAETSSLVTVT